MTRHLTNLCILLLLAGCGYFMSGSWDDDPDNWNRAFDSQKPDDVVVIHSRYIRLPHWSFEFIYYFEIEQNDEFSKQLFEKNALMQLNEKEAAESKNNLGHDVPDWFLPLPIEKYDVWKFSESTESNFRVFVERESGSLFMTDYQI